MFVLLFCQVVIYHALRKCKGEGKNNDVIINVKYIRLSYMFLAVIIIRSEEGFCHINSFLSCRFHQFVALCMLFILKGYTDLFLSSPINY